ncbi:MAG: class I SAM-dependent methyltransferase [Halobacteriaceae archaeon]
MNPEKDAYGQVLSDYYRDGDSFELFERDDGYVGLSDDPATYFQEYEEWPERHRAAMDRVHGRVLDVGCGAGRHALCLQERGFDVVGVDTSPKAVEVCERRGLEEARVLGITDVDELDGEPFGTVLLLGNNFGLLGTRERAPDVLETLAGVTTQDATLLAESMEPNSEDPSEEWREYHESNVEDGRLPGVLRMRIRYKRYATDWFDYLLASREEMREILDASPWRLAEFLGDGADYVGVAGKEAP